MIFGRYRFKIIILTRYCCLLFITHLLMNPVKKHTLIYRLAGLGDRILVLPAFQHISNSFTRAYITLLNTVTETLVNYLSEKKLSWLFPPYSCKNMIACCRTECAVCGLTFCLITTKECIMPVTVNEVPDIMTRILHQSAKRQLK
jgi:hypothetical protein